MANVTTHTFNTATIADRIRGAIAGFQAYRTNRAEYVATVRELDRLTNRELNDLGMSRYDIPRIAHDHVYGA